MRGFNHKKAVQALNLIAIRHGGEMNKMKAIKLIWLADRYHLRTHGRTITGDMYYALKNGPVPSNTRDLLGQSTEFLDEHELAYSLENLQDVDSNTYRSKGPVYDKVFSVSDLKALEKVLEKYSKYSKYQLRDLSHLFPEWKKYEDAINKGLITRQFMPLSDFFLTAPKEADFLEIDNERLQVSKEVFLQDVNIAKALK